MTKELLIVTIISKKTKITRQITKQKQRLQIGYNDGNAPNATRSEFEGGEVSPRPLYIEYI